MKYVAKVNSISACIGPSHAVVGLEVFDTAPVDPNLGSLISDGTVMVTVSVERAKKLHIGQKLTVEVIFPDEVQ